jgi:hypothetical protein
MNHKIQKLVLCLLLASSFGNTLSYPDFRGVPANLMLGYAAGATPLGPIFIVGSLEECWKSRSMPSKDRLAFYTGLLGGTASLVLACYGAKKALVG